MDSKEAYEKRIATELHRLPHAALVEVLRIVTAMGEKYRARQRLAPGPASNGRSRHEHTRQLLASSQSNWAQDLIQERDDRL